MKRGVYFIKIGHARMSMKALALIIVSALLFNITAYDLPRAAEVSVKDLHVNTFSLPEHLGRVVDYHAGSSGKIVIHIQDAHCNYAAQKRIAEMINYLSDEYGVDMINLEGGGGDYNLSVFTGIDDPGMREKVADFFVRAGTVNGAEYFAINYPEKAVLWGVEDTKLYIDNLNVYRESFKHKDEIDRPLNALTHILTNLKNKIYASELLDMDQKYEQYKSGRVDVKEYLTFLAKKAKERLIDIKRFKNIFLLEQVLDMEKAISFKEANRERGLVLDRLKERLSNKEMEDVALKTLEFKSDRVSPGSYYAYLSKKARSIGLETEDYPEFQKYLIYLSTYDAIDKAEVMKETGSLESAIKETIYTSDKERELGILIKNLRVAKDIFNIALPKDEYMYYRKNEAAFAMKNYTAFISREAPLYKISAVIDDSIERLDQYREEVMKFYEYSFERDKVFVRNMKFQGSGFRVQGTEKAILITGGFHTENLCELFRREGISYISIMPIFKNEEGYESPYFGILAGGGHIGELTKAISAQLSVMQAQSPYAANASQVLPGGEDEVMADRAAVVLVHRLFETADKKLIVRGLNGEDIQYELAGSEVVKSPVVLKDGDKFIDISTLVDAVRKVLANAKAEGPRPTPPQSQGRRTKGPVAKVVDVEITEGRIAVTNSDAEGRFTGEEIILMGRTKDSAAVIAVSGKAAEIVYSTRRDSQDQTTISAPPRADIGAKGNNWNGLMTATTNFARNVTKTVRHSLFYNKETQKCEPAKIYLPISEEMTGKPPSTPPFKGFAGKVRNLLQNNINRINAGNIEYAFYDDTDKGYEKMVEEIKISGMPPERIVVFAYTNRARDAELEKSSYVVYLTGEMGKTATPVSLCGDTGLAILNYFDKLKIGNEADIKDAVRLVAEGVGSLAGVRNMTIEELELSITENGRLRLSGFLNIVLMPIDPNEIAEFHESELLAKQAV